MTAYYNEFDKNAAAWLRELINQNLIAPGDVDERSIKDVLPDDLRGYTQCHFFAGIGVWSHALRGAGWADDRPVWTGSCPCQPFSAAGKGGGFDDARHLWPDFYRLIAECRPDVILGEQVASKDGLAWLDLVYADLEDADYAVGSADTCAAGFGAPHIRQRLYWSAVADASREGSQGWSRSVHTGSDPHGSPASLRSTGGMADDASGGRGEERQDDRGLVVGDRAQGLAAGSLDGGSDFGRPGPTNGLWGDADWLLCRDGKWRPVEPGTFPLAHGVAACVGRLRGYGNALVAPQAQAFVETVNEWLLFGDLI